MFYPSSTNPVMKIILFADQAVSLRQKYVHKLLNVFIKLNEIIHEGTRKEKQALPILEISRGSPRGFSFAIHV